MGWILAGILLACVTPGIAVSTAWAKHAEASVGGLSGFSVIYLVAIGLLALITHMVILFSGVTADNAKRYWIVSISLSSLDRRLHIALDELENQVKAITPALRNHLARVSSFNDIAPSSSHIKPGPFVKVVRSVLSRIEVIEETNNGAAQQNTTDQSNETANPGEGGINGPEPREPDVSRPQEPVEEETDHSRTILQRIRDEEIEVKP